MTIALRLALKQDDLDLIWRALAHLASASHTAIDSI